MNEPKQEQIRAKKLKYLAGLSFDDKEWDWYSKNKNALNSKAQSVWDKAWRIAEARLVELEKIDAFYSQPVSSDSKERIYPCDRCGKLRSRLIEDALTRRDIKVGAGLYFEGAEKVRLL